MSASRPAPQAAYYVLVGEYRDWDLALDQAGRQTAGVAAIVSRSDKGGTRHRVILGPHAREAAGQIRGNLPEESAKAAWLAKACPKPGPKHGGKGCMDFAKVWR